MSNRPPNPLTRESFFSRAWRARGEVRLLSGRTLRTFDIHYVGERSPDDGGWRLEEHVVYGGGGRLDRSWQLWTEPDGSLVGLEPSQGGRMQVRDIPGGLRIRYDRLRLQRGPNVSRIVLDIRREADGAVRGRGTSGVAGLPLIRTRLVFTEAPPQATG